MIRFFPGRMHFLGLYFAEVLLFYSSSVCGGFSSICLFGLRLLYFGPLKQSVFDLAKFGNLSAQTCLLTVRSGDVLLGQGERP